MKYVFLILSLIFLTTAYVFPVFLLPMGKYVGEIEFGSNKVECVMKFHFNGEFEVSLGDSEWEKGYYKTKFNEIILSSDKTFNKEDTKISTFNFHNINILGTFDMENGLALVITWIVLFVHFLVILSILPGKNIKK